MRIVSGILLILAALLSPLARGAEDPGSPVITTTSDEATTTMEPGTREQVISGGVDVVYGEFHLICDKLTHDPVAKQLVAEGHVRAEHLGQVWIGERLEYNYATRRLKGANFRTGQIPFFAQGSLLDTDNTTKHYSAEKATVTTDDYAEPGYSIKAKKITIVPGEYIRAEKATIRIGNTPVFYLPVWRRSLKRHPNYWVVVPGYRSRYGPFLLNSYHYYLTDRLETSFDADVRQKRGFGYGPQVRYDLKQYGEGEAKFYRTHDDAPGLDLLGRPIDAERQRFWFEHQAEFQTNLTFKAAVRYQSDAQVIRDFFEPEYRKTVQPATFVEVQKSWRNWSLNTLVQPRVNDFYETVERLPDIKLTGLRQQVGETPIYYESESSMGYFRREFAESVLPSYGAVRGDTYHQLILPRNFFNWLNVTPRVGARGTYYGEENGSGTTLSERQRFVFNTGAEFSTKVSRVWGGAENRFFEVKGLRHIFEPSLNYVFVPTPSRAPAELPQFDYDLPSRRLQPIEYPDYNAIDSVDSQNVIRMGLRNKLQTKRNGMVEDLVAWSLYTDWRLHPRVGQNTFADLFSDLDLSPFHWLTLSSELRYNLDAGIWKEANHYVTFVPNNVWSFSVGHRYFREDPVFGPDSGHNLLSTRLYYRLSENWGFRATQHFEGRDGKMEEQMYTIYRDFRSWTGAFTFRVRESRTSEGRDFTVGVIFNLKAFPRFKVGDDLNRPSLLLGGE